MSALVAGVLERPRANLGTYAGLFIVTLSNLMYEILLTRIFSVTMWYHFAFVAISVALFGMTVGALIVYLLPDRFPHEKTTDRLTVFSLLFGISIVLTFLTQLSIPFVPDWSVAGVYSITLLYLVTSIPFIFGGVCVCLALTRFPGQISRLYAADLVGAAMGAIALVWLLNTMDGPSAVIVVGALPAVAAAWFAGTAGKDKMFWLSTTGAVLLFGFALTNAVMFQRHSPLLRVTWVGGTTLDNMPRYEQSSPDYEKWNAFSRIKIDRLPATSRPFGWGMSDTLPEDSRAEQLQLVIDSVAGTVLTRYDGAPQQIDHLKYDVVNLAHQIRKNADVLVIGVGGGRDVLSALAFDQASVTGVEINAQILDAVNNVYGDFTGHLDKNPRVTFINDEARSYVARSKDRYDIIQSSLTDTWAASSAGAYALSENSLYTVEAWGSFLDHLTPNGILTVSRWYYPEQPMETYRLTALATETLRRRGIDNPRDHIYIAKGPYRSGINAATMMVSSLPFTSDDLATLERVTKQLKFDPVLTPDYSIDAVFSDIAAAEDVGAYAATFPVNISPPTDDSPFFFQMIRLEDLFAGNLPKYRHLTEPVLVLAGLTIAVLVLTFIFILLPLCLSARKVRLRGMWPFFIFFAAIGLGFLLIEVSQMQRLIMFLGHPTYGLSVVLFALLLFGGIGSFVTERIARPGLHAVNLLPFVPLLILLMVFGFATPLVVREFEAAATPTRVLASTAILAPMGLAMGMPFPVGMKVVSAWSDAPTPFFWGVNGAASVCASVLAIAIALSWGISTAFWVGCVCYGVAVAGLGLAFIYRRP